HQLPDRAFQGAREGSPLAPRAADARLQTPPAARLSQGQGCAAVLGSDQATRNTEVTCQPRAVSYERLCLITHGSKLRALPHNSQLITHNSQLITHNSQLITPLHI